MKRRLLATFLSLCLLVGLLPTVALAEESPASETQGESSEQQATATDSTHVSTTDILSGNSTDGTMSGTCGATEQDNVRWTLNKNGETVTIDGEPKDAYTLTISGTGAMADISYNWTDVDTAPWAQFRSQITRIVIDEGITSIGKYAFIKTSIRDLDLSVCSSLTCISERAFSNIGTDFVSVTFPESLEEIGEAAFSGAGFTEVDLTKCKILHTLGDEAFGYCSNLKSVNILECESLREIGRSCFYSCQKLEDIKLPNSITSIKDAAFTDTGLTKVNWNNLTNLENIAGQVFSKNNNLSVVSLSGCSSLKTIGQYLFVDSINVITVDLTGCTSLTQVEYPHEFDDVAQNCVVYSEIPLKLPSKTIGAITDGGTFAEDTTFTAGTLATPTKDGAIFEGWYDNEQCSGTVVDSPTAGHTYYAKWTNCSHSAGMEYTAADAVITEKCSICGQVFGTATISAPTGTLVYDGTAKTATVDTTENWGGTVPTIAYKSGETPLEGAPINAGTYTASITVGDADATAEVEFTIAKASTSIGIETDKATLTGGGTVTLTVTKTGLPQDAQVSVSGYSNIIDNGDGTYTVALPNSTATYTFTASYAGDANHKDATANCNVFVTQYTGGGSSSSGGSSSGSSSVSGSGDNVIITASSGTVTDAQMESAVKKANKGSTITIKATGSTSVTLPVGGLADAADNDNDVLLDLRYGEITLSARAIAGMTDGVSSNDKIKVSVTSQTNSKDETISDLLDKGGAVFDVSVEVDGVEIHSFDGTLTITLTVSNLSKISDPHVLHILTDGTKEYYAPDRISGNTITVKGVRNLSTFAVIPGSEVPQTNPFTDVTTSDYYYDAVLWAVANGVTNGSSATTFSPNVAVSRAQMVTFLWRAHGSPEATGTNPFTDVSTSDYYYDAVLWAVANGVTNGTSATTFSPDAPVTRAQAVTFQWRAAGSPVVSGSSFGDVTADAYYANAVTWAVANGITNGTSGTTFSPDVVVSRAQAVTFLWRELA